MPLFTPPTAPEGIGGDPLFSRYTTEVGQTVMSVAGTYTTTPYPWLGDIADLTEGVDYFLGGRTYVVSDEVATALTNDGYTIG